MCTFPWIWCKVFVYSFIRLPFRSWFTSVFRVIHFISSFSHSMEKFVAQFVLHYSSVEQVLLRPSNKDACTKSISNGCRIRHLCHISRVISQDSHFAWNILRKMRELHSLELNECGGLSAYKSMETTFDFVVNFWMNLLQKSQTNSLDSVILGGHLKSFFGKWIASSSKHFRTGDWQLRPICKGSKSFGWKHRLKFSALICKGFDLNCSSNAQRQWTKLKWIIEKNVIILKNLCCDIEKCWKLAF